MLRVVAALDARQPLPFVNRDRESKTSLAQATCTGELASSCQAGMTVSSKAAFRFA